MRFCQSFMLELSKYIGPDIDVPAGDIKVLFDTSLGEYTSMDILNLKAVSNG